jgi:pimeloyl-ACP methyl ester carboxylesterase
VRSSSLRKAAIAIVLVSVMGAACSRSNHGSSALKPAHVEPTVVPEEPPGPEDPEVTRPGQPEPVAIANAEETGFTAGDGTVLVGQLFGSGNGPGVVLLHASHADMRSWFPFAQRLAGAGYAVLAFDFRGYGQSQGDKAPASYPDDAAGAIRILDASGHRPVALVGAEAGGTAAVAAAARAPDAVRALVVVGGGPVFETLDASAPAADVRARTLVVSTGPDGDRLATIVKGAEVERRQPVADLAADRGVQDRVLAFLDAVLKR